MDKAQRKKIRILYVATDQIKILDIPRALDLLGYNVYQANLGTSAVGFKQKDCDQVVKAIDDCKVHMVFSYDFAETIAQACFEAGVPYVSWVYDAPQKELYTPYAFYPCNYIFVFDKEQQRRLQDIGLRHVIYMPLATLKEKIDLSLKIFPHAYKNDITLVGQLYRQEKTEELFQAAGEALQKDIEESIAKSYLRWDDSVHMHGTMSDFCSDFLGEFENHKVNQLYPYMAEKFYYEAAVLSRFLANRERVHILNTLAEKHSVTLYTNDKNLSQLSSRVKKCPGVKYDTELPKTFYQSKINLNITLHCIEKGLSQRIFDVMGAGGFLISNYQEAIEELFVPGEDLVVYHNMEELEQLVDYYLTHDKEREKIAANGQRKVLEYHEYKRRMDQVVDLVMELERDRTQTYWMSEAEELKKKIESCMSKQTDESFLEMCALMRDPRNDFVTRKSPELGIVREVCQCYEAEKKLGEGRAFQGLENIEEINLVYLMLKHRLWRIEQNLSEEACMDGIQWMIEQNVSAALIAWVAYANLDLAEDTIATVSDYFAKINIKMALEVLIYGLMWFPNSNTIRIAKANLFMNLQMWQDALMELKQVSDPSDEIKEVMDELEHALVDGE